MPKLKNYTVAEYLKGLSEKIPAPGGGSAAALTGALGVALLSMVARYSLGRSGSKQIDAKIQSTIQKSESIRKRLLELVDLDAQAYLKVVKTRKSAPAIKNRAIAQAEAIPREICNQCYKAVLLTPDLVKFGNKNLMSDLEAAIDILLASFNASLHFVHQK